MGKLGKRAILPLLWLGACLFGLMVLLDYSTAPGDTGIPPPQWPKASKISRSPGNATLLMFAHPKCPCTRASVSELAWIVSHAPHHVQVYVLMVKPEKPPQNWENTGLTKGAQAIPGVTVLTDRDGIEAEHFGADTSGQTLLYNAAGQLKFSGGITAARGHAGSNAGRNDILSLLTGGTSGESQTPVFGCSLLNPSFQNNYRRMKWKT